MTIANGILDASAIAALMTAAPGLDRAAIARLLPEAIGVKLRRLAADARFANPAVSRPLKAVPPWTAGEVVSAGVVRSNAGNDYVAVGSGTTAAPGPTHAHGDAPLDGTNGVRWTYLGPTSVTADDPDAPTVAISTSSPNAQFPVSYSPVDDAGCFRLFGGYPEVYFGTGIRPVVYNSNAGTKEMGLGCGYEFVTDAQSFSLRLYSGMAPIGLVVDGRLASLNPLPQVTGTAYVTVAFPTRKARTIQVRGSRGSFAFEGIRVREMDAVWAPQAEAPIRAAFIMDSLGAGNSFGPFVAGMMEHQRVADLLGWRDAWMFGKGATGDIAKGVGNAFHTYGERVPEIIARGPWDVVLWNASTNDGGNSAAAIRDAALARLQALRAGLPNALLIGIGCQPFDDSGASANAKAAHIEQANMDAMTAFADPRTFFLPMRLDPAGPWIAGSYNTGRSGVNSRRLYLGGQAGAEVHAPDIGIAYRAERIATAIREKVLPAV